jgi:dimethylargininase
MIAITHLPSPRIVECELTYLEREPIDFARASRQHAAYRDTLAACGARVEVLDVNREMPDSVFVEDTAVVFPEVAVMMSMGAASRRAEPLGIEAALVKYREIRRVSLPARIDGGDVVVNGRTVLVGLSSRTEDAGVSGLRDIVAPLGYSLHAVRVTGALHLKSACTALPDGRLLVNPAWMEMSDLDALPRVPIAPGEPFAADIATDGGTVIAGATFPETNAMLARMGFSVRAVDLSEFARAEGGVTCLSLIFAAN